MGKVLEPGFQAWGMLYAFQVPGMKTPQGEVEDIKKPILSEGKELPVLTACISALVSGLREVNQICNPCSNAPEKIGFQSFVY